jgi:protein xylosyltransferase
VTINNVIIHCTLRFIQKQGVERIFVQCDNRMWRVGERKLPRGIRLDGGSDWVALNREFCEYLVTSKDEMIQGLQEYWKYTLLPGEVCNR